MARGIIRRKSKETVVQPKLKVGQPGDKYEQEADSVADRVVANNSPQPAVQMAPSEEDSVSMKPDDESVAMKTEEEKVAMSPEDESAVSLKEEDSLSMKPDDEVAMMADEEKVSAKEDDKVSMKEDEAVAMKPDEEVSMMADEEKVSAKEDDKVSMKEDEAVAMKPDEEVSMMADEEKVSPKEEDNVSMKEEEIKKKPAIQRSGNGNTYASAAVAQQIHQTKGQGTPMGRNTQQELGDKMGADFSRVRIHTDQNAMELNNSLGAKAFTHGHDIYFNTGNYDPGSSKGKHLLAHELTHVIQQKGGLKPNIQRKPDGDLWVKDSYYYKTKSEAETRLKKLESTQRGKEFRIVKIQVSNKDHWQVEMRAKQGEAENTTQQSERSGFEAYPSNIEKGLQNKEKWAYTAAAKWDIEKGQVSFSRMDETEAHDNKAFNSHHFVRVTDFYYENAAKAGDPNYSAGETEKAWKECSPAMYYAMNRLYNWTGSEKIKSGYVEDYKDPDTGKKTKGIVTLMKEKKLIGAQKLFVAQDKDGKDGDKSPTGIVVALNESAATWAKNQTASNSVGVFLLSVHGGHHSMTLVVDRRGKGAINFRLLDQFEVTPSGFKRTKTHTSKEIDDYFVTMANDWGAIHDNYNFQLFQLLRD